MCLGSGWEGGSLSGSKETGRTGHTGPVVATWMGVSSTGPETGLVLRKFPLNPHQPVKTSSGSHGPTLGQVLPHLPLLQNFTYVEIQWHHILPRDAQVSDGALPGKTVNRFLTR